MVDSLKDIGNEIFYCPYLLGLPTEYLILYFRPSIPFSLRENWRQISHLAAILKIKAYANICWNTLLTSLVG